MEHAPHLNDYLQCYRFQITREGPRGGRSRRSVRSSLLTSHRGNPPNMPGQSQIMPLATSGTLCARRLDPMPSPLVWIDCNGLCAFDLFVVLTSRRLSAA